MSFNYSTRDGQAILSQIESDLELREQPSRFKIMISGIFDVLNNTLNAVANAMQIRTMYSRPHAQDLLNLIDYQLEWKRTSFVDLTVVIDAAATTSNPYTVTKANLKFGTVGTVSKPAVQFEARADVTYPQSTTTTTIRCYAQETQAQKSIGVSSGASWMTFDLADVDVLSDTITLFDGTNTYTKVNNFVNSISTDNHFRIYYRTDGSSYVKFGGIDTQTGKQYGRIPTNGLTLYANYAIGGGANTVVNASTVTEYLGNDSYVLSSTNPASSEGGLDEETLANAREIAPLSARTAGYFINASNGVALAKTVSGVLDATVIYSGVLACDVYIIPTGGGNPSTTVKNNVQNLLISASPLSQISVTALNPNYISQAISFQVKVLSGYSFDDIKYYCKLAVVYRLSEIGKYIKSIFDSNGIEDTITAINASWSSIIGTTFTLSKDSTAISKILLNVITNEFNIDLQTEYLITAVEGFVDGVDYIKIITPSSTVSAGGGGIVRASSVTVTQI